MKDFLITFFVLLILFPGIASCSTEDPELPSHVEQPTIPDEPGNDDEDDNNNTPQMSDKLTIRVGTSYFSLTLEANATATAFKALLPLTLNMAELNGNEKFWNLSTNLTTSASRHGTLQAGDLMLYGSNCLVLFYESFSSSYSYTRLGRVDNPAGLSSALGTGSVTVVFEIATNKP